MIRPPRPATADVPWRWAAAGAVLGLVLVLVLAAPARWLAAVVAQASGGRVLLAEPAGRVWAGSARLVLTGGEGSRDRAALPGRLQWRLSPAFGALAATVSADCCTPPDAPLRLRLSARWDGAALTLADGLSHWPAAVLAGLGTPFNTIEPEGELNLATQGLGAQWQAGRLQLAGSATLTARQLSSRLSTLRPMGSYQLVLQGGPDIGVTLSTLEGRLQLSGSGHWVGTRLRFQGEARAAPGLQAQLANLLNILGRREGDRAVLSIG